MIFGFSLILLDKQKKQDGRLWFTCPDQETLERSPLKKNSGTMRGTSVAYVQ